MQKRGQIGLYLIIAVVMLGAFGYGFYYLIHSNVADEGSRLVSERSSLDAQTNLVQSYVQSCLEKRTKEGIDFYGIKDTSAGLIMNYIDTTLDKCVDYDHFSKMGLRIERGVPKSSVFISEEAILVGVSYPINIKKDTGFSHLESFEYNIQREVAEKIDLETQSVKKETRLVAEDKDAEFVIQKGTIVYSLDGAPVNNVSVIVQDKNVKGLSNNPVIGMSVYEGKPEGVRFEPAIEARFSVNYEDVPLYFPHEAMKCAYYDEAADIWRTYRTIEVVDNGADERTYTVKCLVDHFSLIAVVNCGQPSTDYFIAELDPFFQNPVKLASKVDTAESSDVADFWFKNSLGNNYYDKGGINGEEGLKFMGIHLIPEKMKEAECKLDRGKGKILSNLTMGSREIVDDANLHYYSGSAGGMPDEEPNRGFASTRATEMCDKYLLQDWDADDNPEKVSYGQFGKYLFYETDCKDLDPKIPLAESEEKFKEYCYADCSTKAKGIITQRIVDVYYSGVETDKSLISADGLNDYIAKHSTGGTLYCTVSRKCVANCGSCVPPPGKSCPEKEYVYITPQCIIPKETSCSALAEATLKNNIQDGFESGSLKTIDYPVNPMGAERTMAFFATPISYGYSRTRDQEEADITYGGDNDPKSLINFKSGIVLGGYGQLNFEIAANGGSCINSDDLDKALKAAQPKIEVILLPLAARDDATRLPLSFRERSDARPITLPFLRMPEAFSFDCSDNCVWALNEESTTPGQLRGGENVVRGYVKNLAERVVAGTATPYIDPSYFLEGKLKFIGFNGKNDTLCFCLTGSTNNSECKMNNTNPDGKRYSTADKARCENITCSVGVELKIPDNMGCICGKKSFEGGSNRFCCSNSSSQKGEVLAPVNCVGAENSSCPVGVELTSSNLGCICLGGERFNGGSNKFCCGNDTLGLHGVLAPIGCSGATGIQCPATGTHSYCMWAGDNWHRTICQDGHVTSVISCQEGCDNENKGDCEEMGDVISAFTGYVCNQDGMICKNTDCSECETGFECRYSSGGTTGFFDAECVQKAG